MNDWKIYKNGNYIVKFNIKDGTKIRETEEDEFIADFAENMDIKISNHCDMNCAFCHEGSNKNGKHADILNEKFVSTLHPYQEVALGGGDVTSHPDLIPFLEKLKDLKVIANITVNQRHFEEKQDLIRKLVDEKLIYGIGVSLVNPTKEFITLIKKYPNAVIHTINGILKSSDINILANNNLKLLILGYKNLRRGNEFYIENSENIINNQKWLKENLINIFDKFNVVSFDNLAIEQLEVQKVITKEYWKQFYMGDDGSSTYYIDMVERKFARSSTAEFNKRYDLLDSVDDMFKEIKKNKN